MNHAQEAEVVFAPRCEPAGLAHVPRSGATVFLCPQEASRWVMLRLLAAVSGVRPDVRVVAGDAARLPGLESVFITVDGFSGRRRPGTVTALRSAVRLLNRGGSLLVFPAGEHSLWTANGPVHEVPEWDKTLPRLIRMTGATTVPVLAVKDSTNGANGCRVRFGSSVPVGILSEDDARAARYLRQCSARLQAQEHDLGRLVPRV